MSTVNLKVDGFEVHVEDDQEAFARGRVEVSVARRTSDGLLVERVEPVSVTRIDAPEPDAATTGTYVEWQEVQRIIRRHPDVSPARPVPVEADTVVVRVNRDQARAVAYGLLAWAGDALPGSDGDAKAAGEAHALARADLLHERKRVDDLLETVQAIVRPQP